MTAELHCWHCSAPIERATTRCRACLTDLIQRDRAAVLFSVVGGEPLARSPTAQAESVPPPSRSLGFVARHWRGDIPLDSAFWGVTCFVGMMLLAIPFYIGIAFSDGDLIVPGHEVRLGLAISALALAIVLPWQVVGTIRSATRWSRLTGGSGWAIAAFVFLVLYVLFVGSLIVTVVTTILPRLT
ncbi:MAG: hypothetical protein KIT43_04580 [Bauldia sp.]|nr:hypothetical protein [Bauldia sp.]MCW5717958.1 hypothetical protein [Bauldia sp.]